ncbi:MAG: D-glycero-beta-D-manno-heptose-7-phosphate kinase [Desulfovibrionaceae bacterium]|nr:D-glycero-beta-D-manno-heptose-7-phosphate kinase [Desulfovibrionaceae bacterium]MBF0512608.1 D-glycero-beta-D-manno-heptose-7-phosphate kinase [Desulfovibrionaceae bacterium]
MLDHYLFGEVERISPEAPVPVVRVQRERHLLGGAGNVAKNVASLGGRPVLLGVCGDDDAGRAVGALLENEGIEAGLVADKARATTIKTRIIARGQQVVRVDREIKEPLDRERRELLIRAIGSHLSGVGAVIVSDYGKGVVSAPVMDAIRELAAAAANPPLVIVDPKTYQYDLYHGAGLLTPNLKEAAECSGLQVSGKTQIIKAGHAIFKKLRPKHLLITLGAEGIALFESPGKITRIPTVARNVFDVTGAGDTVIATLALGLAGGLTLLEACIAANAAAGIVVGRVGAASVSLEELRAAIAHGPTPELETWLDEN